MLHLHRSSVFRRQKTLALKPNTSACDMQIHDELVFEAREDVLPHAARIVRRVMEVRHAAVIVLGF